MNYSNQGVLLDMSDLEKPTLVYDGDCGFCYWWVLRWRNITKDEVRYIPFRDMRDCLPSLEQPSVSVCLLESDRKVYTGAEAVFRLLAYSPRCSWGLWMYNHIAGFALLTEWLYRSVARCRGRLSQLIRIF